MDNIKIFYETNQINHSFNFIEYAKLNPQTNNFCQPYCIDNNIDDLHRLYYHYAAYGGLIHTTTHQYQPSISEHNLVKDKVSLVLLNWARTENVIDSLSFYTHYDVIKDIIVINNNPSITFKYDHHKVNVINASKDLSLFSRFSFVPLVKEDSVLFIDDDIFINEYTVNTLYKYWCENKSLIHGLFGRGIDSRLNYQIETNDTNPPIVLTRCCMTHRDSIIKTLPYIYDFNKQFPTAKPKGNGEDILLSISTLKHNSSNNKVYNLPHNEYIDTDDAIHTRFVDHLKHRSEVVKWCMKII